MFTNTRCNVSSSRASATYCRSIAAELKRGGAYLCFRIHRSHASVSGHVPAATTSYTRCHTTSSSFSEGGGARGSTSGIPLCFVKPPSSFTSSFFFANSAVANVLFFAVSSSDESELDPRTRPSRSSRAPVFGAVCPLARELLRFQTRAPSAAAFLLGHRGFDRGVDRGVDVRAVAPPTSKSIQTERSARSRCAYSRMSWFSCDRVRLTTIISSFAFSSARSHASETSTYSSRTWPTLGPELERLADGDDQNARRDQR